MIIVANGNLISIVDSKKMECLTTIQVFQKPIMKVEYDSSRERIIATGLDCQIKFFELFEETTGQL